MPVEPSPEEPITVPVYREEASVHKRVVDTGRVRIHTTVARHPARIDESLRCDEVQVSHVPVDRIVQPDQAPTTHYDGDTLVVPILEEVLVVERRLRIKEELRITRTQSEKRHLETVMLKAEQVSVERTGAHGSHANDFIGGGIMQHTLVAVFDNPGDAQNAMDQLLASGFSRSDINISSPPETGAAREDTTGGAIKHFFSKLFGSSHDEHAAHYSNAVERGQHVLTFTSQSEPEIERAADVVERFGPVDIDDRHGQAGGATTAGAGIYGTQSSSVASAGAMQSQAQSGNLSGAQSGSMQRDTGIAQQPDMAIPVVQEDLKIGKREVQRGGVRVLSRIVETPVDENVALREEHVHVERHPVDQPISATDASAFQEKSIELRETAEEAVVQKSARVVEEVVVGKDVSERQQQIHDKVRHTEVKVESLPGSNAADDAFYRQDWQTRYANLGGSYDDYAPAYLYGNEMRGSAKYQGRQWDDVESDLRSDWDARHAGGKPSTWEKMKAAIRSGWDRMTT